MVFILVIFLVMALNDFLSTVKDLGAKVVDIADKTTEGALKLVHSQALLEALKIETTSNNAQEGVDKAYSIVLGKLVDLNLGYKNKFGECWEAVLSDSITVNSLLALAEKQVNGDHYILAPAYAAISAIVFELKEMMSDTGKVSSGVTYKIGDDGTGRLTVFVINKNGEKIKYRESRVLENTSSFANLIIGAQEQFSLGGGYTATSIEEPNKNTDHEAIARQLIADPSGG